MAHKGQISFSCENDFYKALGYLARECGATTIIWENNKQYGAWEDEGRIHFHIDNPKIPGNFLLTAGNKVNCNKFVEKIVTNYGFQYGSQQDQKAIKAKISQAYQKDFDDGLKIVD